MEFSAQQIAGLLNGKVEGDPEAKVSNVSKIEEGRPGTLSFLANPAYTNYIYSTDATIVLVSHAFRPEKPLKKSCTLVRVENPYEAFARLLDLATRSRPQKKGVEQPSYVSTEAAIGEDCYIGAFAYVGKNTRIGRNVKLYPHVYVGEPHRRR